MEGGLIEVVEAVSLLYAEDKGVEKMRQGDFK